MTSQYTMLPFEELLAIPLKNGLTKPKSVRGTGYPLVNMGELFANERIDEQVSMDLAPLSEAEFSSFLLQEADLLFARQSLVLSGAGKCSYVKKLVQDTTFESHIIRARINQSKASPLYYFYFFMSPQGKQAMLSIVEQVAAAGIRGSDLKRMLVPVPPLPEQRAIAAILSALDDKIELNRQMNKTLEEMAQAIFKEWFVDFGPFRDGGMQDSELGPIPVGWRTGALSETAEICSGKRPMEKSGEPSDVFSIPLIGASSIMGYVKAPPLYYEPIIVTGRVGTLGIIQQIYEPSWPSDNTLVCRTKWNDFIYQVLCRIDFSSLNRGSTQPLITQSDLKKQNVVIPPDSILIAHANLSSPLSMQIQHNIDTNKTLSAIRDTLLPKLMSGEIRVPVDAEPA